MKAVAQANPIGRATTALEPEILKLAEQWNEENPVPQKRWWEFWKKGRNGLMVAVSFLINCVDELILRVDKFVDLDSPDKKATVLRAIEILYDHVIKEVLPIWLKPIAGRVKHLIIYVWISYVIDFMVQKYRDGLWREDEQEEAGDGE